LLNNSILARFVTGHDFSRVERANRKSAALQLAEKLDFDLLCNKGATLVGPQLQQNKRRALQAAEKLDSGPFCNKGTTLVGPQLQQNKGRALAPATFLHHNRQCSGFFCCLFIP
jgi:hypothetical protein